MSSLLVHFAEEEIERPTFEKKDLDWEDDMELYSKYLDKKVSDVIAVRCDVIAVECDFTVVVVRSV